ncbi:alpha amylase N-terminal ig-like domain-containing protein [Pseudobutyrivibrio sp.]|uniref:alpha amylase N-terminal ig-like domain-containing protein n=1 Tax=Pseudobutyrivibrio sp. TaxID=2014367 RepID=UPI001B40E6E2|nr:alpha amylase N-terminal ig-like domain-containing protein [Pseudobutyrivibrio sp.]MBP3263420.1 alpha amylase N-terminal ig-like domain-containing protein [Pseudobutyrivibrio sp.]
MDLFTKSIYSDGTKNYVDKPIPKLNDNVNIGLSMLDEDVSSVFLLRIRNGAEEYHEMKPIGNRGQLAYYQVSIDINEPVLSYHFVVVRKNVIYYYTQAGVTTYVPDNADNFVILADFIQPAWVDGAVFYQIFPHAWGNLYKVIEHIPYLKDLGVTAIYLNPIFSAPSNHKYDCSDYFHVDEEFGGDKALEELSKALHANDMQLILDISINHTGITHNWVKEKRHFYFENDDHSLMGWCGVETLPVLDYRNEELRDLIYRAPGSVLRKWLKPPYSIDGWRFDVADVFAKNDNVQLSDELWKEVCNAIREEKPDAFIIGEHWADCTKYLQGDLWNTPMNYYGFGRILRQFTGLPELFVSRNETLAKVPYKMTAEDVVARTIEHYSKFPQVIADAQMNLVDSHDVPRIHNYEGYSFEKVKAVVISQLLWTGIPCVYYGDELGIDGYTYHDSGFRYEMPWNLVTDDNQYLQLYKKAISLRRNKASFSNGSRLVLYAKDYVLAVARFFKDEVYIGVVSMEESAKTIKLPISLVGAIEPSENMDVFGRSFEGSMNASNEYELTIEPESGLLIKFSCAQLRSR